MGYVLVHRHIGTCIPCIFIGRFESTVPLLAGSKVSEYFGRQVRQPALCNLAWLKSPLTPNYHLDMTRIQNQTNDQRDGQLCGNERKAR